MTWYHNPEPLTCREREVLQLASEGLFNRQIAQALHISESTVENHLTHIYRKLGVGNRMEAVRVALRHGWLSITSEN
jgi:two-component system response regulator DesR